MGWNRQLPPVVEVPMPPVPGSWLLAAAGAVLAGVLLFLLYATDRIPGIQAMNIWVLTGLPISLWLLAFGVRAYTFGKALSEQLFLAEEAQEAQTAWEAWAQRYLAVHANCVLLPDQVCASQLMADAADLPLRNGQPRRIADLPMEKEQRVKAGLQLLLPAMAPIVNALPPEQELRVTLLSDVDPDQYQRLSAGWQHSWTTHVSQALPTSVNLVSHLSLQWIEEQLKSTRPAFELLVVLQVQGYPAYSDGLAAVLLGPDSLARATGLAVQGRLLRPMPLNVDQLDDELSLFMQTQTNARQATGLLADGADWKPSMGKILAAGFSHGASLEARRQWIQESFCGVNGPLGHWLTTVLAVDTVRLQQQPLLVLAKDQSQRWISTVTKGEGA
jgi:hypothetical protein